MFPLINGENDGAIGVVIFKSVQNLIVIKLIILVYLTSILSTSISRLSLFFFVVLRAILTIGTVN